MEWIAPIIAGIFALATAISAGVIAKRGTKQVAREDRAPDVTDSWREADNARRLYYHMLEMFYAVRTAFRSYVLRVGAGGSAEMTAHERKALELEPPEPPKTP